MRLAPRRGEGGGQIGGRVHEAHALAAAAIGRFDQQGVTDGFSGGRKRFVALVGAAIAGHGGHTRRRRNRFGRLLVAHRGHRLGCGADKNQPRRPAGAGKVGVFGHKAVAGMNGLGAHAQGG